MTEANEHWFHLFSKQPVFLMNVYRVGFVSKETAFFLSKNKINIRLWPENVLLHCMSRVCLPSNYALGVLIMIHIKIYINVTGSSF